MITGSASLYASLIKALFHQSGGEDGASCLVGVSAVNVRDESSLPGHRRSVGERRADVSPQAPLSTGNFFHGLSGLL